MLIIYSYYFLQMYVITRSWYTGNDTTIGTYYNIVYKMISVHITYNKLVIHKPTNGHGHLGHKTLLADFKTCSAEKYVCI